MNLRQRMVRLAQQNPQLKGPLLSLLRKNSSYSDNPDLVRIIAAKFLAAVKDFFPQEVDAVRKTPSLRSSFEKDLEGLLERYFGETVLGRTASTGSRKVVFTFPVPHDEDDAADMDRTMSEAHGDQPVESYGKAVLNALTQIEEEIDGERVDSWRVSVKSIQAVRGVLKMVVEFSGTQPLDDHGVEGVAFRVEKMLERTVARLADSPSGEWFFGDNRPQISVEYD